MKEFLKFVFTRHKPQIILSVVFLVVSSFLEGAMVVSFVPIIDLLTKKDLASASEITLRMVKGMNFLQIPPTLNNFIIIIISFVIFKNVFFLITRKVLLEVRYRTIKEIICDTYKTFFNAEWSFLCTNSQGVLTNTLITETFNIGDGIINLSLLLSDFFRVLLYFSVSLYASTRLSLIIIFLGLVSAIPFSLLGRLMRRWGLDRTDSANKIFNIVQETLGAAKVIIGYEKQNKNIDEMGITVTDLNRAHIKPHMLDAFTKMAHEPVALSFIMLSIYLAINYFHMEISELFVVLYSFRMSLPILANLVALKNKVINILPSFQQILDLKGSAQKQVRLSGNRRIGEIKDKIVFQGVSFGYPDHKVILHDLNIDIPKGKMIAFVGESGAGKSTVIDLLMAFYQPGGGVILVDGVPLPEYDIASWRYCLGYVPQDSVLFNISLKENLLWAKEDATGKEIDDACRLANADEFVCKLRDGYDTIVGDRGVRLSGGQRQRIALARALLRRPKLLILDEATSALDSRSELLIQQAIEKISSQTTVVVVAHRLSTIIKADCIYVMDNGRVADQGTYSELMSKNSKFSGLASLQGLTN
ncbi:MAG: ABC transporter ATP-binding protein [bacterium]